MVTAGRCVAPCRALPGHPSHRRRSRCSAGGGDRGNGKPRADLSVVDLAAIARPAGLGSRGRRHPPPRAHGGRTHGCDEDAIVPVPRDAAPVRGESARPIVGTEPDGVALRGPRPHDAVCEAHPTIGRLAAALDVGRVERQCGPRDMNHSPAPRALRQRRRVTRRSVRLFHVHLHATARRVGGTSRECHRQRGGAVDPMPRPHLAGEQVVVIDLAHKVEHMERAPPCLQVDGIRQPMTVVRQGKAGAVLRRSVCWVTSLPKPHHLQPLRLETMHFCHLLEGGDVNGVPHHPQDSADIAQMPLAGTALAKPKLL